MNDCKRQANEKFYYTTKDPARSFGDLFIQFFVIFVNFVVKFSGGLVSGNCKYFDATS